MYLFIPIYTYFLTVYLLFAIYAICFIWHENDYTMMSLPRFYIVCVWQFLQRKFLEFCRKLTVYGSAFFTGSLQPNSKSSILCHIGVNDVGIHIINMKTKVSNLTFTPLNDKKMAVNIQLMLLVTFFYSDNKYMYQVWFVSTENCIQTWLITNIVLKVESYFCTSSGVFVLSKVLPFHIQCNFRYQGTQNLINMQRVVVACE